MKAKKLLTFILAGTMALSLASCGGNDDNNSPDSGNGGVTGSISVLTREEGSGTRSAFAELFEIEEIMSAAEITNSTGVMMTTIAGNEKAIGYISLGSLDDSVKAIKIDGAAPTVENIESGSYKISRPFNIATKDKLSAVAQDFIDFIMSADGQKVVSDNGYIAQSTTGAYAGSKPSGKVTVSGSTSVGPLMVKLKEAYLAVNTNAEIDIQENDSSSGVKAAADGVCDIGMASRALKDSETAKGLKATVIATDGIAVIVNKTNTVEDLSSAQIKSIFTGETTTWDTLNK